MRKLRHFSLVVVLIFAFATSGFAGIIPTVPGPEPAPSPSTTGIIEMPPSVESDAVIDLALALLRILAI
jgi:hypothetical protein